MITIKTSIIPMNQDLSIMALDLIKHLGLGITLEDSKGYDFDAQHNRCTGKGYEGAEIIVGIDEDCFITRPEAILEMAQYMVDNKVPFMAMQELSGVSTHRATVKNATEQDFNSFFMMTQPNLIDIPDKGTIYDRYVSKEWIEQYWMIFRCMANRGIKGEALDGFTHEDEISTILTWDGKPFCLHTWFARDFNKRKLQKGERDDHKRILDRYADAQAMKIRMERDCEHG